MSAAWIVDERGARFFTPLRARRGVAVAAPGAHFTAGWMPVSPRTGRGPAGAGRRCAAALFLGLALFTSAAAGIATGAAVAPAREALMRLAASVGNEWSTAEADFAGVALAEVILAYETEFERLSARGQVSRREYERQARWAASLEGFLAELYGAWEALDSGAPVRVLVSPPAGVHLEIGERLVAVSSPRIADPEALDAAIVNRYCDLFACDPRILASPLPSGHQRVAAAQGGWSVRAGMGTTFETADGLGFMFADLRGRDVKEAACRRVHAELKRLADALASVQRRGQPIDFDALVVESAGGGDSQHVVLSHDGARLRMPLPALGRAPAIVEVAREWLRARVMGRSHRQLFPRSDLLLAGLLADF